MIESGIRGEKGLVDARTNVKGKMREKDAFLEKLRCQGTRCVGATTVVRRELNGGCIDVTFQFEGKGGRGKKRRWRRSKVRPAGSSPPLTKFYAIYTFESVADDDRGLHPHPWRIVGSDRRWPLTKRLPVTPTGHSFSLAAFSLLLSLSLWSTLCINPVVSLRVGLWSDLYIYAWWKRLYL